MPTHARSRSALSRLLMLLALLASVLGNGTSASADAIANGTPFVDELGSHAASRWLQVDGSASGAPSAAGWRADHLAYLNFNSTTALTLTLDDTPASGQPYASGQLLSTAYYGYGCFELRLKPARGAGLVTDFATLAGAGNVPSGGTGAHNEIGLRFLGGDTTRLTTRFFTNDNSYVNAHEELVDLGFDAADGYHNYAVKWSSAGLEWWVDGRLVRTAVDDDADPTPDARENTQRLALSLWPVDAANSSWGGSFSYPGAPVRASVDYLRYSSGEGCRPQQIDDPLSSMDALRWQQADGWTNGPPFANGWRADHISFTGGLMELKITNTPSSGKPYSSGEYRTQGFQGYGCYETRIKPPAVSGVVTSLFTFAAGPWDNSPGGNSHHQEIDLEFLGKDTTSVQFNYYTNDDAYTSGREYVHQLGFDAAADFHNYAFKWTADRIAWYVDGTEVYSVTDSPAYGVPRESEGLHKLMLNMWPVEASASGWAGAFTYPGAPVRAQYDWVTYTEGADCRPRVLAPQAVALAGPSYGLPGRTYAFTATSPLTATQPMTYTWLVDGVATRSQRAGGSDTLQISWPEQGLKTIVVTIENAAGSASTSIPVAIRQGALLPLIRSEE